MGSLVVRRTGGSARFRKIRVMVDGAEVARVGYKSAESVPGWEGKHDVWVELDWLRSETLQVDFSSHSEIVLDCGWRNDGLPGLFDPAADRQLWLSRVDEQGAPNG